MVSLLRLLPADVKTLPTLQTKMNTGRLLPLVRRFSATSSRNMKDASVDVHPGYLKIKERQKQYQIDNGLRIHERGGPIEKVSFSNLMRIRIQLFNSIHSRILYHPFIVIRIWI